ncbi:MAG: hypothetical protein HY975_00515 [Candidatus Kerfeldbacteria bacterium]|nr:hypothetical protein [Candidatus Kerfeldbacteria bacterium]
MATIVSYGLADGKYTISTDDHRGIIVAPHTLVIVREAAEEHCYLKQWYWWLEVFAGVLYLNQRSRNQADHFSLLTPYGAVSASDNLTEFVHSANQLLPSPPLPAVVYPS